MPAINVVLKDGARPGALEEAKKAITDQGGKITHEFKLVKGFNAEVPPNQVNILEHLKEDVEVENDGEVRTQ